MSVIAFFQLLAFVLGVLLLAGVISDGLYTIAEAIRERDEK